RPVVAKRLPVTPRTDYADGLAVLALHHDFHDVEEGRRHEARNCPSPLPALCPARRPARRCSVTSDHRPRGRRATWETGTARGPAPRSSNVWCAQPGNECGPDVPCAPVIVATGPAVREHAW